MQFDGVDDRTRRRGAARRTCSPREPLDRATPLDDGEFWVHELVGTRSSTTARARARHRRRRSRPTPRTICSCSTAARWSRWCSSSSTRDGVVVVDPPDGLLELVTCASTSSRSSPTTSTARSRVARSGGRAPRAARRPACTTRATTRRTATAASTTRRSAAGAGMVMMPEPLFAAVEAVAAAAPAVPAVGGRAALRPGASRGELAGGPGFSLLCGRYEGVDQRVADHLCDGELSVGDYVLAGGEAAALVVIDAVARLVPGVMGNEDVGGRRVVRRRPARVPAVHPPGRVPGPGGARGAAQRRPRPDRPVAAGAGAAAHARPAARPARAAVPLTADEAALLERVPRRRRRPVPRDPG